MERDDEVINQEKKERKKERELIIS